MIGRPLFRRTADALMRSPQQTTAAALSLMFTAVCGWAVQKAMDPGNDFTEPKSAETPTRIPSATSVTERQALSLFEELADNKDIPFDHRDGCFARAEEMRRLLEQKGIQPIKVWAFQDHDHALKFQRPVSGDPPSIWVYHVAVALPIIDSSGQKKIHVFDPTIFDAPVEVSEWAAKLNADLKNVQLTKPDTLPLRYKALAGSMNLAYTRDQYTSIVAREFSNYHNAGRRRSVYSSEFRRRLCSRYQDSMMCEKKGQTWISVLPPPVSRKPRGYAFKFGIQF